VDTIVEVVTPQEVESVEKPNGRKPRSRKKKTEPEVVNEQQIENVQVVAAESLLLVGMTEELRQATEACQLVQGQLRSVQQELHTASRELEQIHLRSQSLKQELADNESLVQGFRQLLSLASADLQERVREVGAGMLPLHQECAGLQYQLSEVRQAMELLRAKEDAVSQEGRLTLVEASAELRGVIAELREVAPGAELRGVIAELREVAAELAPPPKEEPAPAEIETPPPLPKRQLGITVDPDARVVEVLPETPADRAGLRVGDVVIRVESKPVANSEELRSTVEEIAPDRDVLLTVSRGQEKEEVSISLTSEPVQPAAPAGDMKPDAQP